MGTYAGGQVTMEQTTIQTVLTVGMPTLAVLVGILVNNSRLGDLRAYMDGKFADNNSRLNDLRAYMEGKFADVNRRLDAIERRLDHIEQLLGKHDSRITVLEERTNPLRGVR
jgi:hypothetical protein